MREGDRGEEREKKDRDNGYRGEEERRIGGMREREREREERTGYKSPDMRCDSDLRILRARDIVSSVHSK